MLDKEPLLREIKHVRKRFEREAPDRNDAMDRMLISSTILSFVVARALFAEPPELHTAEGEALELTDDLLDEAVSIDMDDDAGGLPAEVAAEVERQLYTEHYRKWIDEPLPALGGRTPREASTIKRLRRRLRALVEAIENQAAHLALDNRRFDVAWLRKELGFREEQTAPQRTAVNRA